MNSGHTAVIIPFDRPFRALDEPKSDLSVTQAAVAAADRMEGGAAQLLEQVETDKEIVARVQAAMNELMGQVEVLETTAERLVAALRTQLQDV